MAAAGTDGTGNKWYVSCARVSFCAGELASAAAGAFIPMFALLCKYASRYASRDTSRPILLCNHNAFTQLGTARFQKGYLAYAGAGKNSRGTQLIMSFQDNLYLGGGSPWEVPFAQVFGASSFETLGTCCSTLRLVCVE
jgi:hypothetical protein